jgi:phospholipid/cholesterol/gamma-HCH transport system substrate-binding protein
VIRTAIKFGLFVVVCLFFTGYLAFTIGNRTFSDPLERDNYKVAASFDDVSGLLPDDNVKVAGVVIGKVTEIKVVDGRARVSMQIKNEFKLPSDSTASIRWRNLIGQRYVYLQPGRAATVLAGGDQITKTTSVVDLGELFNRLGPIDATIDPKQVNDFLDTVSQALDGNTDKIGKSIDDLAVLAKSLSARDETIGRLVENLNTVTGTIADRDQQIRVMLDNLVLISQTFSDNTQVLDTALQEFGTFSADLNGILTKNSSQIDRIIDDVHAIAVDVVSPKLETLDHALKGIDLTAKKVFSAGRLGEWLNESILCAATGPPPPGGPVCATPITTSTPDSTGPAPASVGSGAANFQSGVPALEKLVTTGGVGAGPR